MSLTTEAWGEIDGRDIRYTLRYLPCQDIPATYRQPGEYGIEVEAWYRNGRCIEESAVPEGIKDQLLVQAAEGDEDDAEDWAERRRDLEREGLTT